MVTTRKVTIKEVCEITSSKRIYVSDYQTSGIPFYRGREIIERQKGTSTISIELYINEEKYIEIKNKFGVPNAGDVLLTSVGTLGVPYLVKNGEIFYFKDGNITWFRKFHGLDSQYLYYWILSPEGKAELKKCIIGSSQPAYTIVLLKGLQIQLPSIQYQQKVASLLAYFDRLIENNTKRIQILEEMAQTIYHGWFINFHFPGHENVPMVESELGNIPKGWTVGKLIDVLSILESGSRPSGGINPNESEIPSIGAENILGLGKYDYSKEKYVTRKFFDSMTRGHIMENDVLLYKDGASLGRKSLFRNGFPHNECCINEHVFILRTNEKITQSFLYFWVDQPEMTQNIRNLNSNAAQPGINQSGVNGLPIIIPSHEVLDKFDEIIEPILSLLFTLAKKNNILQKQRDLLLPELISGNIQI